MQGSSSEQKPKPGKSYIFFIGDYKGHPHVLKVLPVTDENLATIRALGN